MLKMFIYWVDGNGKTMCCWKLTLLAAVWIGVSGWKAKSNYHNLSPICLVNEDVGFAPKSPPSPVWSFNFLIVFHALPILSSNLNQMNRPICLQDIFTYLNSVIKATLRFNVKWWILYAPWKISPTIRKALSPRNTSRPYQENAESAERSRITH